MDLIVFTMTCYIQINRRDYFASLNKTSIRVVMKSFCVSIWINLFYIQSQVDVLQNLWTLTAKRFVHLHFILTYFIAEQINVRVVVFLTIRVYIMIIIKLKIVYNLILQARGCYITCRIGDSLTRVTPQTGCKIYD